MEAHFVHQAETVLWQSSALYLNRAKTNPALSALTAKKLKAGESVTLKNLNIQALLPKDSKSFQLKGSLTTPPCSENVTWVVLKTPVQADGRRSLKPCATLSAAKTTVPYNL